MPPPRRKVAMKLVAQEEWNRCAEDIFYWLDPQAHLVPYAYTKDPHTMFTCNLCTDGNTYITDKRKIHLLNTHKINADSLQVLKDHFVELDPIRPFTIFPYFRPIIEQWLSEPLMAIEKSRDMMATWLIVACYTWDALYHKGRQHIFQSETAAKTRELVGRSGILFENQPKWLKSIMPARVSEGPNKAGLLVVPGLQSEIIGFPQGADKVRQYHPSGFFSDEAAFNPEAEATFAAVKPSIQNGGRYTAVSSANPGFFQRICRDRIEQAIL